MKQNNITTKFPQLLITLLIILVLLFSAFSHTLDEKFLACMFKNSNQTKSEIIFTQKNTKYSYVLESSIINLKYSTATTPKPLAIITTSTYSHVQSTILCSKSVGFRVRIRSGGHDYAGVSHTSYYGTPFIVLDLKELRTVKVDSSRNTAWVESGATLGELYYWVSKISRNLGFPGGICPTVGVGGHLSGGGFGILVRKYGLAADNVVDARIIDVNGRILDRKSMGEDLFWAIRGGGGGSFGVVVAWKVNLVYVPDRVSVFSVSKTLEQGGSDVFNKWQYIGHKLSRDLFIRVVIQPTLDIKGDRTIQVIFNSMFLGMTDKLIETVTHSFPELGLEEKDCREMSWIESILYFSGYTHSESVEILKDRISESKSYLNAKSDYVKEPIPIEGLEKIWKWCLEDDHPILIMEPHGGRMDEIEETITPYPHRNGYLYNIQYFEKWEDGSVETTEKHSSWMRRIHENMTPYVSKNPRVAYVNYRDLDLGVNGNGNNLSYSEAMKWGSMYFSDNFRRLALVKGVVDPDNFFHFEQSIPPLVMSKGSGDIGSYQTSGARSRFM